MWHLEVPPEREKELREWERLNKKKAKKLESKPRLLPYLQHLLTTFLFISRRRQFGLSELPLSIESIIAYGDRFGFKNDARFFLRCMSDLDDAFLKFKADQRKSNEGETPSKAPSKTSRRSKKS